MKYTMSWWRFPVPAQFKLLGTHSAEATVQYSTVELESLRRSSAMRQLISDPVSLALVLGMGMLFAGPTLAVMLRTDYLRGKVALGGHEHRNATFPRK